MRHARGAAKLRVSRRRSGLPPLLAAFLLLISTASLAGRVTVFAAASLKESLDAVVQAFEAATGHRATVAYAASSSLAKQIQNGAPADLFICADSDWIDYLEQRGLVVAGSRRPLLANQLVLITRVGSPVQLKLSRGVDIAAALGKGRIALANPAAVPAGKYARAAFESLGVWSAIESKVAAADNVRAAVALVARGEAPLGVAYRTDALAVSVVRVVDTFPEGSHPPIVYPMVRIKGATGPAAEALAGYLDSPLAAAIFERFGFRKP